MSVLLLVNGVDELLLANGVDSLLLTALAPTPGGSPAEVTGAPTQAAGITVNATV